MPDYYFQIRSAFRNANSGEPVRLPNLAAAKIEAMGMFADFARNIAVEFATESEWQIEVLDQDGMPVFRLKIIAETP